MISNAGSKQQTHSMSTSISQGPPDLVAVAAAAAAADSRKMDSGAVNSSRIGGGGSTTNMDVIPRPLRVPSGSPKKGVLEASVSNFGSPLPAVKPAGVEVDVEEHPPPACCLPFQCFSRKSPKK